MGCLNPDAVYLLRLCPLMKSLATKARKEAQKKEAIVGKRSLHSDTLPWAPASLNNLSLVSDLYL